MVYNGFIHKGTPMTELQTKVFNAVKSGTTDEEKTFLAIDALRMWYYEQGYFSRAYRLESENPQ
jgi:hypothetical protein